MVHFFCFWKGILMQIEENSKNIKFSFCELINYKFFCTATNLYYMYHHRGTLTILLLFLKERFTIYFTTL